MADTANYYIVDSAARNPIDDGTLSLRTRALLVIGLALAAWVPVLLPIYLIFHR